MGVVCQTKRGRPVMGSLGTIDIADYGDLHLMREYEITCAFIDRMEKHFQEHDAKWQDSLLGPYRKYKEFMQVELFRRAEKRELNDKEKKQ